MVKPKKLLLHTLWRWTAGCQTNPSRWDGEQWPSFVKYLDSRGITVHEGRADSSVFISDAGGLAHGLPHGVVRPFSSEDVSEVLKAAQIYAVPVTVRGGGLTTEGESIAFGGLLLDMSSMNRVLRVDPAGMTVRTEAGIYWHQLAETLRRDGLDYLSAPLKPHFVCGRHSRRGRDRYQFPAFWLQR